MVELISITDGLTNIYNRRHFNDTFPAIIKSSKRLHELLCFLIMDIDHFKQYNDTYGHQMGDSVLIKVAKCMKDSLNRDDDTCYRLGGEEFGILYKASNKENALIFANIVRENIENLKIEHSGNSASAYITASMGLICKNANELEDEDLAYKQADDLLYKAKESGRNKVVSN
jgi:diguanylate cyclase (GGDEF)-like protein